MRARRFEVREKIHALLLVDTSQTEEEVTLQTKCKRGFGVCYSLAGPQNIDIQYLFLSHFLEAGSAAECRDEPE